ncbi:sulfate reduction electron transfer complex DsrMKJOP subunit DsrP [Candidatus Hydrogenedentota bacterium]
MLEKALTGSKKYFAWLAFLSLVGGVGVLAYLCQFVNGLAVTGLSRDVSWGLYIAQFTFLVGVAASAVTVVLPYYLHDQKAFGKITVLGEFLAVGAVIMCVTFIFVDLGKPTRVLNVLLHPSPRSLMFWDMLALNGYLFLNIVLAWFVLDAERNDTAPPKWVRPLAYLSIPMAISIHTVTAFLYCGLPGRHLWLTAILAPRFLASAFAAGPALLIMLCYVVKKVSRFTPPEEAIKKLATVATYAMIINVFFIALEFFTAFYSNIPGHRHSLQYLYFGLDGHNAFVPWMWFSTVLAFVAIAFLLFPAIRTKPAGLIVGCVAIIVSTWIDKGLGLIAGGFVPTPLGHVTEYAPTLREVLVTTGVYAIGAIIITVLYKIAISVKEQAA